MRFLRLCLTSAALGAVAVSLLQGPPASGGTPVPSGDGTPGAILESYAQDFRFDAAAGVPRTVGFRVGGPGGGPWTMAVSGEKGSDGRYEVELRDGAPEGEASVYVTDAATLQAIDSGQLNGLTAQGKAFPGDPTPLSIEWGGGMEPEDVNAFSFHFWTRSFPEQITVGRELGRVVHGVKTVPIYYEPGLRTIWASIAKGERASNGSGQPMVLPFSPLFVGLIGEAKGTVGEETVEFPAGEAMLVPPMTPHEFWNEGDEPAEALFIFIFFGAVA